MTTPVELADELERLDKEATVNNWRVDTIEYEKYGQDVSLEINSVDQKGWPKPILQTIMRDIGREADFVKRDHANLRLVCALRNNLPQIIAALRRSTPLGEGEERAVTTEMVNAACDAYEKKATPQVAMPRAMRAALEAALKEQTQ